MSRGISVKGEDVLASIKNVVRSVQSCEMCVKHQDCKNNILCCESLCSSVCEECLKKKSV